MHTLTRTLTIPGHHNGPDGVGQGGMLAGHLARLSGLPLDVPFEVMLRAPAPLDTPLRVDARPEGGSSLWLQDTLVAEARPATAAPTAPPAVPREVAEAVAGGLSHANPFPRCFVCGHERGDGVRVLPGSLPDGSQVAAVLRSRPGGTPVEEVVGALDCTSGHALLASSPNGLAVTGRMLVQLHRSLPDTDVVVVADVEAAAGRKLPTRSAIYTADGQLCAAAHVLWIALEHPTAP